MSNTKLYCVNCLDDAEPSLVKVKVGRECPNCGCHIEKENSWSNLSVISHSDAVDHLQGLVENAQEDVEAAKEELEYQKEVLAVYKKLLRKLKK